MNRPSRDLAAEDSGDEFPRPQFSRPGNGGKVLQENAGRFKSIRFPLLIPVNVPGRRAGIDNPPPGNETLEGMRARFHRFRFLLLGTAFLACFSQAQEVGNRSIYLTLESGKHLFEIHRIYPDKVIVNKKGGFRFTFPREEVLSAENPEVSKTLAEAANLINRAALKDLADFPFLAPDLENYRIQVEQFAHVYDWLIPQASATLIRLREAEQGVDQTLEAAGRANQLMGQVQNRLQSGRDLPAEWERIFEAAQGEVGKIPYDTIRQSETLRIEIEKQRFQENLGRHLQQQSLELEQLMAQSRDRAARNDLSPETWRALRSQMESTLQAIPDITLRHEKQQQISDLERNLASALSSSATQTSAATGELVAASPPPSEPPASIPNATSVVVTAAAPNSATPETVPAYLPPGEATASVALTGPQGTTVLQPPPARPTPRAAGGWQQFLRGNLVPIASGAASILLILLLLLLRSGGKRASRKKASPKAPRNVFAAEGDPTPGKEEASTSPSPEHASDPFPLPESPDETSLDRAAPSEIEASNLEIETTYPDLEGSDQEELVTGEVAEPEHLPVPSQEEPNDFRNSIEEPGYSPPAETETSLEENGEAVREEPLREDPRPLPQEEESPFFFSDSREIVLNLSASSQSETGPESSPEPDLESEPEPESGLEPEPEISEQAFPAPASPSEPGSDLFSEWLRLESTPLAGTPSPPVEEEAVQEPIAREAEVVSPSPAEEPDSLFPSSYEEELFPSSVPEESAAVEPQEKEAPPPALHVSPPAFPELPDFDSEDTVDFGEGARPFREGVLLPESESDRLRVHADGLLLYRAGDGKPITFLERSESGVWTPASRKEFKETPAPAGGELLGNFGREELPRIEDEEGNLYVFLPGEAVAAFPPTGEGGTEIWRFPASPENSDWVPQVPPLVLGKQLIVIGQDGIVRSLNPRTGTVLEEVPLPGFEVASTGTLLTIGDNRLLYFQAASETFALFDWDRKSVLRTSGVLPSAPLKIVVTEEGILAVTSSNLTLLESGSLEEEWSYDFAGGRPLGVGLSESQATVLLERPEGSERLVVIGMLSGADLWETSATAAGMKRVLDFHPQGGGLILLGTDEEGRNLLRFLD
jgi:hypothetical protein